jgi:hypothetical protein
MRSHPAFVTILFAVGVTFACTQQTSRGPVQWTATNSAAPAGQDENQLWSRATSNDDPEPTPDRRASAAPAAPPPALPVAGAIELPPGVGLVASANLDQVLAFPEEAPPPAGSRPEARPGVARIYDSPRPYGDSVDFVQRAIAKAGCEALQQTSTSTTTVWAARCRDGRVAHIAIRNTRPTTIEVVEAEPRETTPPMGVTNAQPPSR